MGDDPSTNTRFCGRELNAATATAWAADNASLCSKYNVMATKIACDKLYLSLVYIIFFSRY